MDNTNRITRRSAIVGAATISLMAAIPGVANGEAGAISAVEIAIAKHKIARRTFSDAIDHEEAVRAALKANPEYEPNPKVQVGTWHRGMGQSDEPIYAYSIFEVEKHRDQWVRAFAGWREQNAQAARERFGKKSEELLSRLQKARRMERDAGLWRASNACRRASIAEEHAAMAVMLAIPSDEREAERKRRYMRRKPRGHFEGSFTPAHWDADSLFNAIKATVSEMAGA